MSATTSTSVQGISNFRARLGAALQKHRLRRNLTQAELAEYADLSLKYVGEIERGVANVTLEVLERVAAVVGWNPMDAPEGEREPLSEGVRTLLLDEIRQILERLRSMMKWLQAIDPALQAPRPGRQAAVTKMADLRPARPLGTRTLQGRAPVAQKSRRRSEAPDDAGRRS